MQSALRLAGRRAAGVSSRRGASSSTTTAAAATTTTTITEAEREWVASLVRREVRAQMLVVAEERAALERAMAAEWSAHQRAWNLQQEGPWNVDWTNGFLTGHMMWVVAWSFANMILIFKR